MHFHVLAARITELKQRARWNSLESMVAVGSNLIAPCSLVMSIIFIIWVMVISVMWVTWYSLLEGPKEMAWNTGEVWCDHLSIILLDSNSLLARWILNTTSPSHSGLHTLQEPKKKSIFICNSSNFTKWCPAMVALFFVDSMVFLSFWSLLGY